MTITATVIRKPANPELAEYMRALYAAEMAADLRVGCSDLQNPQAVVNALCRAGWPSIAVAELHERAAKLAAEIIIL